MRAGGREGGTHQSGWGAGEAREQARSGDRRVSTTTSRQVARQPPGKQTHSGGVSLAELVAGTSGWLFGGGHGWRNGDGGQGARSRDLACPLISRLPFLAPRAFRPRLSYVIPAHFAPWLWVSPSLPSPFSPSPSLDSNSAHFRSSGMVRASEGRAPPPETLARELMHVNERAPEEPDPEGSAGGDQAAPTKAEQPSGAPPAQPPASRPPRAAKCFALGFGRRRRWSLRQSTPGEDKGQPDAAAR